MPRRRRKETTTDPEGDALRVAALLPPGVSPSEEHLQRTADAIRGIARPPGSRRRQDPRPSVVDVDTDDGTITVASVEEITPSIASDVAQRILRRVRSQ